MGSQSVGDQDTAQLEGDSCSRAGTCRRGKASLGRKNTGTRRGKAAASASGRDCWLPGAFAKWGIGTFVPGCRDGGSFWEGLGREGSREGV